MWPPTPDAPAPGDHHGFPGRHGFGFPGGPAKSDALATALGLTVDELRTKLQDGTTTIADIAKAQGVDLQKVIDALVAPAYAHIDAEVKAGTLTDAEGATRKTEITDRITKLVNEPLPLPGVGPGRGFGPGGAFGHHDGGPQLDVAAKALGMTTADLLTELRAGKSIADVAKEKNVDVQKVIDALVADAKTRITDMVNNPFKGPHTD